MDHDVDFVEVHAEEPFGFDHFEAFVHHGGGIDGDALAHLPVWMLQGLFGADLRKLAEGRLAERAAGGGEDQALNFFGFAGAEALVDGVVFAVDGEQHDFVFGDGGHDDFAGGDQDFFIGERDCLPSWMAL